MNSLTFALMFAAAACALAIPQGGRSSATQTECQRHRKQEQDKNARGGIQGLVPECNADGSYASRQCWGQATQASGGGRFCVCWDKEGKPITSPSKKNKACECILQKHEIGNPAPGTYVPQCEMDGTYKKTQLHASTGQSWCVEPNRGTIQGAKSRPGQAITCN